MQAIRVEAAIDAKDLRVSTLEDLQVQPGKLVVDVVYAGLGLVDTMIRKGYFSAFFPFPIIPGLEVSGYVRSIGEGVEGFHVGQPVAVWLPWNGGSASQVLADPFYTVALDEIGLDLKQAASAVVNLTTAYIAAKQLARVQAGDTVIVHGALGGLGSLLGQVSRVLGASQLIGVVGNASKQEQALKQGYDQAILRNQFETAVQQPAQVIFDTTGGQVREQSLAKLAPLGRLIIVGNASGADDHHVSSNDLWLSNKIVGGFALGTYTHVAQPQLIQQAIKEALTLLAEGKVSVDITGIYALEDVAAAHQALESGQTSGKLLLQVAPER